MSLRLVFTEYGSQRTAHMYIYIYIYIYNVKNLKFGTPQTIAIIVLKIEKFDVTLH